MTDRNDRNEQRDIPTETSMQAYAHEAEEPDETVYGDGEREHHHHHHHHHHHRRHRTKLGRFFSHLKRKIRKKRRVLLAVLIVSLAALILLIATLVITYSAMIQRPDTERETTPTDPNAGTEAQILIRIQETPQLLVPAPILSYVDRDANEEPRRIQDMYGMLTTRTDRGYGVTVNYALINLDRYVTVTSVTVTLSQHEDYEDAQVVRITRRDINSVTFENLETGRLYYFKIEAMLDNGVLLTTEHYFYTVTSPRLLTLEGMVNVRDLGGWMYIDGETEIKQGLLYRGSEFDGLNGSGTLASAAARDTLLTKLNIRSVLDLRGPEAHVDGLNTLGKNVSLVCTNVPIYDEIMYRDRDEFDTQAEKDRAAAAKAQIKEIFTLLADESVYPIYMHDVYGVDETGTVCALLEAYLGVSEQDIEKDYNMTTFSLTSVSKSRFKSLLSMLKKRSSHGSLQEGALLYLRDDCGVSAEDLLRIKTILTEEAHGVIEYRSSAEEGQEP